MIEANKEKLQTNIASCLISKSEEHVCQFSEPLQQKLSESSAAAESTQTPACPPIDQWRAGGS
jgi:hypothetical protein